jgi:heat-inducible transcriptional repressor
VRVASDASGNVLACFLGVALVIRKPEERRDNPVLTERQATVLRAMVRSYVAKAAPIGSQNLADVLPMKLSSASVRNTLAELTDLGLVEKTHVSSGRIPSDQGLRLFVDNLLASERLDASHVNAHQVRTITYSVEGAAPGALVNITSQLLSECTRQLGFVVPPRIERMVLSRISLVRLAAERVLVVLVSEAGSVDRRIVEGDAPWDQRELDRMGEMLNERVSGRTLVEVQKALVREADSLRDRADEMLAQAIKLGCQAVAMGEDSADLVIETRLALLDQPEFQDSQRIRDLFGALETKERLLEMLDQMLDSSGVGVVFGDEVDEPGLRRCALVASHYGGEATPLGMLGVIGPVRMDYSRVIPLVDYLSQVMTDRLRV